MSPVTSQRINDNVVPIVARCGGLASAPEAAWKVSNVADARWIKSKLPADKQAFENAQAAIHRLEAQIENHEARNATDAMIQIAHILNDLKFELDGPAQARMTRMLWSAFRGLERQLGPREEIVGGYACHGCDSFEQR